MNTIYGQLQASTFERIRAKMNSGDKLTFADIEDIALYDVALNRCLMHCRMSGLSLNETLITCVFVLAEQKRIMGEQLMDCVQRNGTGQPIVIVDTDGKTLGRFRVMAKGDKKDT